MYVIGGKARRKETTRKTQDRLEDTIKMDLREIGWGSVDRIVLVQGRDGWRVM
jgi:hypothetical protein